MSSSADLVAALKRELKDAGIRRAIRSSSATG